MTRNFKVLGLALVAALAMSVMGASAAQANPAHFVPDPAATSVDVFPDGGTQDFNTNVGNFECESVTGDGEVNGPSKTQTIQNVVYSGDCTALGAEINTTVAFNSCHYLFHAGTMIGENTAEGTADIVGEGCGEDPITIDVSGLCLAKVGPQNGLGPVTFSNAGGSPDDITVDVHIENTIEYEASGLLCDSEGKQSDGDYSGKATVIATDANENQVDLTVEETE